MTAWIALRTVRMFTPANSPTPGLSLSFHFPVWNLRSTEESVKIQQKIQMYYSETVLTSPRETSPTFSSLISKFELLACTGGQRRFHAVRTIRIQNRYFCHKPCKFDIRNRQVMEYVMYPKISPNLGWRWRCIPFLTHAVTESLNDSRRIGGSYETT